MSSRHTSVHRHVVVGDTTPGDVVLIIVTAPRHSIAMQRRRFIVIQCRR